MGNEQLEAATECTVACSTAGHEPGHRHVIMAKVCAQLSTAVIHVCPAQQGWEKRPQFSCAAASEEERPIKRASRRALHDCQGRLLLKVPTPALLRDATSERPYDHPHYPLACSVWHSVPQCLYCAVLLTMVYAWLVCAGSCSCSGH